MRLVALRGVTPREQAKALGINGHVEAVIKASGYVPRFAPNVTIESEKGAPFDVHWLVVFEAEE